MQISKIGEQDITFEQLENIGFTNKNIEKYVEKFNSEENKRLMKFLKNNKSIWGIAHVPINLELICSIWDSYIKCEEQTEYTMTDLYCKIVEKLLERYLNKFHKVNLKTLSGEEFQKKTEVVTQILEKLALKGITSNHIIFSKAEVNELLEGLIKWGKNTLFKE